MKKIKAFSLIELQISMIIASILVLTIGAVSHISASSHNKIRAEAEIYNDISYGLKLVKNRIRKANDQPTLETGLAEWIDGERLVVDNQAFGMFQQTPTSETKEFIYLANKDDLTNREVIFSMPATDRMTMSLTPGSTKTNIKLDGEKDGIPFLVETDIIRRIQ